MLVPERKSNKGLTLVYIIKSGTKNGNIMNI